MRCPSCSRDITVSDGALFCPMCGATLAMADGDAWIGRTIAGRFTIKSLLGEGGIGRVYVAEQTVGNAKRRLAVKMLLPEHASNPEMVRRFFRECEVVSLVEHPNVVRIYDFGEAEPGAFYIAMELVAGRSLAAILRSEGPLPPERALHVLAQACRAVAAVHERGVIHRDLKPDNLMISATADDRDFVKVLDFGIAKPLGAGASAPESSAVTRAGVVLGSPPYMSPEQFLGEDVDVRTDVYALGVVAYEMTTGALPFEASSMSEWATRHLTATPRPFDDTKAGTLVPHAMRDAILHALAKRREDRPATARDLLSELTRTHARAAVAPTLRQTIAEVALPLAETGGGQATKEGAPLKRGRSLAIAIIAAVAGAATAIAVVALLGRHQDDAADHATERSDAYVGRPASPTGSGVSEIADHASAEMIEGGSSEDGSTAPTDSPPRVSAPPPTVDVRGCERALRATTCSEARAAQRTCPDAAGQIHHDAHEHVARLCGAHGH